jgi:hypothetical protein
VSFPPDRCLLQTALIFVGLLVTWQGPSVHGQVARARIVDEMQRQPVAGAEVVLVAGRDTAARATSGADGFFQVVLPSGGTYRLVVSATGFGAVERQVRVGASGTTLLPAIVLEASALPLDPVQVEAARRAPTATDAPLDWVDGYPVARPASTVAGARLADMERRGASQYDAVRQLTGVRVRAVHRDGRQVQCVETIRPLMGRDDRIGARPGGAIGVVTSGMPGVVVRPPARVEEQCSPVTLVIDGIIVGDGFMLQDVRLVNFESIEYLSPLESGVRFGPDAAAFGAIVLWSRGRGPHRSPDRDR